MSRIWDLPDAPENSPSVHIPLGAYEKVCEQAAPSGESHHHSFKFSRVQLQKPLSFLIRNEIKFGWKCIENVNRLRDPPTAN